MAVICSHVLRVFVTVYVLLFCEELAYRVEGDTRVMVATVGDNITLRCYPPRYEDNRKCWYRGGQFFVQTKGVNDNPPSFKKIYTTSESLYTITISNANIDDSNTYICYSNDCRDPPIVSYELHVIGCSCEIKYNDDPTKEKIYCHLDNFSTTNTLQLQVTINQYSNKTAVINGRYLSFSVKRNKLNNGLQFQFNPYMNAISTVTCTVPALLTSPHPSTRYPTTPWTPTTRNGRSEALQTTSKKLTTGAPMSTTKNLTPQNTSSSQENSKGDGKITMIIIILGSIFILILIAIIVVIRCKQTKDRQRNKHGGNVSLKEEHPEACYESVENGSQKGPENAKSIEKVRKTSKDQESVHDIDNDGLVDNILYDSSDRITENSISRVEGPLDNALYAMPDKRATINRESKSEIVDGSSSSDVLYGNSDIISQHEQSKDTLRRGDQYENVEMPGSGSDAEEIQLYAMPDKGPKRNTLKTTPKPEKTSTLSRNEVVDADSLYAEVDKPKKK